MCNSNNSYAAFNINNHTEIAHHFSLSTYLFTISKIVLKMGRVEMLPTKNPSTSANLIKFSAFVSVTLPPYTILTESDASSFMFVLTHFLIVSHDSCV